MTPEEAERRVAMANARHLVRSVRHKRQEAGLRPPSPPVRYELQESFKDAYQRQQRQFLQQRGRARAQRAASSTPVPWTSQNQRRPGHDHGRPSGSRGGGSQSSRSNKLRRGRSSPPTTTSFLSSSRDDETSDISLDEAISTHEDHHPKDDTMSLISMTGLIADDVCRLQNCRFENIGPDISHIDVRQQRKENNRANHHPRASSILDMDVSLIDFGKSVLAKTSPTRVTQVPTKTTASPSPNKPRGSQTPETGSMNSGSYKASPQRDNDDKGGRSSMEVKVVDESDTISEITPTGCPGHAEHSPHHRKHSHPNVVPRTTQTTTPSIGDGCCATKVPSKASFPEESLRDFLTSVAKCLPNQTNRGTPTAFSRSRSEVQAPSSRGTLGTIATTAGRGFASEPAHAAALSLERNRSFDGSYQSSLANASHKSYGHHSLASLQTLPASIVSAPAGPVFKSQSDRYHALVIGRLVEPSMDDASPEHQVRKYSPAWFKSRRDLQRRRNNVQILAPVAPPSATGAAALSTANDDALQGCVNVEVVWKPSKSLKKSKQWVKGGGSSSLEWTKTTKDAPKAKGLKKLFGSKSGKHAKHVETEQENPNQPHPIHTVSITATDTTRWDLATTKECVSSSVLASSEDLTMGMCNADSVAGASQEHRKPPLDAKAVSNHQAKQPSTPVPKAAPTKESASPPDKTKNPSPVWRGTQDSTFTPQWPKMADKAIEKPSKPSSHRISRGTFKNCYHKNSDKHVNLSDMVDDDSVTDMPWNRSTSFDETDCGQEDLKVLSIVGPTNVRSSPGGEPQRRDTGKAGEKASSSPFGARFHHTSLLRQQQQKQQYIQQRRMQIQRQRQHSRVDASDRSSSPEYSYSTNSSSSPTASNFSTSTSSSSSRPVRKTRKSANRSNDYGLPPGTSQRDIDALRCLSDNDNDAEFAVALTANARASQKRGETSTITSASSMTYDNSTESDDDESDSAGFQTSPWRRDYREHARARERRSSRKAQPVSPPKIQRRRSMDDQDHSGHQAMSVSSNQNWQPIPRHRRMLV